MFRYRQDQTISILTSSIQNKEDLKIKIHNFLNNISRSKEENKSIEDLYEDLQITDPELFQQKS